MRRKQNHLPYELTYHARQRQVERYIPTVLIRLAVEKGGCLIRRDCILFVLGVAQMNAAGFGPAKCALEVVVRETRIVTVMWLDATEGWAS